MSIQRILLINIFTEANIASVQNTMSEKDVTKLSPILLKTALVNGKKNGLKTISISIKCHLFSVVRLLQKDLISRLVCNAIL